MTEYTFENNALYRYTPIHANADIARKEIDDEINLDEKLYFKDLG